jgi:hypothetical protein
MYEAALKEFERVSAALTAALVDRHSNPEVFPALAEAEASARDAVMLTRMRLINAWRDSQPQMEQLTSLLSDSPENPA